jgi:hypothetical protein
MTTRQVIQTAAASVSERIHQPRLHERRSSSPEQARTEQTFRARSALDPVATDTI